MTWAALLLADPSACLRFNVLRELFKRPEDDPEVRELSALRNTDPLVVDLMRYQNDDGSWQSGLVSGISSGDDLQATGWALSRLGFLGFDKKHDFVRQGAEYLFSKQEADGSWPLPRNGDLDLSDERSNEGYTMKPLQTALPLRGLASCGYAQDPRCERAYDWLLDQRLDDGAWPTGIAGGGIYGYVAGYRRLAHSRWGCRSNTTGSLACFALHPTRRFSQEAQRALDLLLGRETRERQALGFETARLVGAEKARGFLTFYALFDLAFILKLCWKSGGTLDDERIADMASFVTDQQGDYGIWDYTSQPQVSRWVTFDIVRTMAGLDEASQRRSDWVSMEPRTPFQPYPTRQRRV